LMEIEAFIHGALCVAQSGRCRMSLYTDNASANRGACLQNCRAAYKVTDIDTGKELVIDNQYVMSAADICTIDFLDELLDAGVQVMKIEGRGRAPEYVATVVKTYKQALQDIQDHTYTPERIAEYYSRLETVYNHTLSRGNYYLGKELGSYSDVRGSKATTEKEHIGRVLHYYPKTSIAEFQMESGQLTAGSPLLFIGSTTGALEVTPESIWVDDCESQTAQKGVIVTCKVPVRVRENDKVYIVKPRDSW
ncbi:MAG: U32 family peptidase, partial [Candidatus Absconditabacterales bacterium]